MYNLAMATIRETCHVTGLPGFEAYRARVGERIAGAGEGSVSVIVVDIDLFGKVNEKHGRAFGDAVLHHLSERLQAIAEGRGEVLRCGGDAFAILLDEEKEQAYLMAETVRRELDGQVVLEIEGAAVEWPLHVSAGVAAYPDDGQDETLIIRKANEAIYRAKVSGRNKVCLARDEKMITKTTYYTQGQLHGLSRLAKREKLNEATLLREAMDDLLRKYNA